MLNGTYTISFDASTKVITFTGTEANPTDPEPEFAYYLVGDNFGDWAIGADTRMTETSAGVWTKTFTASGTATGSFKVQDTNGAFFGPTQNLSVTGMEANGDNYTATVENGEEYKFTFNADATPKTLSLEKIEQMWKLGTTPLNGETTTWEYYPMTPNAAKTEWTYTFARGTAPRAIRLNKVKGGAVIEEPKHSDLTVPTESGMYQDGSASDSPNTWLDLADQKAVYTLKLTLGTDGSKTLALSKVDYVINGGYWFVEGPAFGTQWGTLHAMNAMDGKWSYTFTACNSGELILNHASDDKGTNKVKFLFKDFTTKPDFSLCTEHSGCKNLKAPFVNGKVYTITLDPAALALSYAEEKVPTYTYELVGIGNVFDKDCNATLGAFPESKTITGLDMMPGEVKLVIKKDDAVYRTFNAAAAISAAGEVTFGTEPTAEEGTEISLDGLYNVTVNPTLDADYNVTSCKINFDESKKREWPDLYLQGDNYGGWNPKEGGTKGTKFTRTTGTNVYTLILPDGLKGGGKIATTTWGKWEFTNDTETAWTYGKEISVGFVDNKNCQFPTNNIKTEMKLVVYRNSTFRSMTDKDGNNHVCGGLFLTDLGNTGGTTDPEPPVTPPASGELEGAVIPENFGMTVYFQKPADWNVVKCYAWIGDGATAEQVAGGWPGTAMTESTDNPGYYEIKFAKAAEKIIFCKVENAESTSNQEKTKDLVAVAGGIYTLGSKNGDAYECTPSATPFHKETIDPTISVDGTSMSANGNNIVYPMDSKGKEIKVRFNVGAGNTCYVSSVVYRTLDEYKNDANNAMNAKKARAAYASGEPEGYTPVPTTPEGEAEVTIPLTTENQGRIYIAARNIDSGLYTEPTEVWFHAFSDVATGVESLEAAEEVQYFNLQGARVQNPQGGIFIRVSGGKATKVAL